MFKNVAQFEADVNAFFRNIPEEFRQNVVQKIALDVLTGVVLKTPVDTGRARGNWRVGLESPQEDDGTARLDPSGGVAIAEGASKIATAPAFGVIWIFNNLPYIERLENGWSRQAPTGMLVVTLNEVGQALR